MSKLKVRSSEELAGLIAKLLASAEVLQKKADEGTMSEEDTASLAQHVTDLEALVAEKEQAESQEKLEEVKERISRTPAKPLHRPQVTAYAARDNVSVGEGFSLWFGASHPEGDRSHSAIQRARSAGFDIGRNSCRVPVTFKGLNKKKRATLSKGGTGTGAEYVWESYSDKVTTYLSYYSPILGMVDSETTADGNLRSYFIVDDTAMKSTYITASSGTELVPTIPDTNLSTGSVQIGCFDITSGVQKVTFQELRDSFVTLEDKIAEANANSHARKIEEEIFTAAGDGTTGVKGITASCTSAGTPAAWTAAVVKAALATIPSQYRKEVVFACNDTTRADLDAALVDDIGNSQFDKTVEDDVEYDVLFGKKFIVSNFIADDTLLIFNPTFYKLRMVSGSLFQQFVERYWPHVGWAGMVSFGGCWVGPATAAKKLVLA
jgi:HK97 family phage major capsid protein